MAPLFIEVQIMANSRLIIAAIWLACPSASVFADPQPGDIYREYSRHNGGDRDWRVTDADAIIAFPRAKKYLPNPILTLEVNDLEHAIRAELLIDRWGGHRGTINKRIRFNQKSWVTIPEIANVPKGVRPEQLMFQDNPIIEIPLQDIVEGSNTFEGDCDEEGGFGWGQWGLYSVILRVYYDAAKKADHCSINAAIVTPATGDTIFDSPNVVVECDGKNGIARIDILAHGYNYDFDGDGQFADWQESHFQLVRGQSNDIRNHVGTLWSQPYETIWNTRWLPDQAPESVELIARVQDAFGYWTVTEPVERLTLQRTDTSVQLYEAVNVPEDFDVRVDETKSCVLPIPGDHNLSNAVEAALHVRTWHGSTHEHSPIRLNDFAFPASGKNHHFDYDLVAVPTSCLMSGDNTFTIHSETEHHMLEVLWPGPALVVRYETSRATKPMTTLHPQAQEFIEKLAADKPPSWRQMSLPQAREAFDTFREIAGPSPEPGKIEDRVIEENISVRIYHGSAKSDSTPVIYFHGGGWVLGDIETHDPLCRRLAVESGATVISVNYRLAPEFPFPAPLTDCYAATRYVAENADEFGVDPSKLIVCGDSAGGNLAAAVALRARDNGGPAIAHQLLLYPVVSTDFANDSYMRFSEGHGLTRDAMMYFWECYVSEAIDDAPPFADLLKIDNLRGLPPAHVFLASHDVLHDEGAKFAQRLADAGVTTTTKTYPGTLHGFIHSAGLFDDGLNATSDVALVIKELSR